MSSETLHPGYNYLHSEQRKYQLMSVNDHDVIPVDEGTQGAILDATGYERTHTVRWVLLLDPTQTEITKSMARYIQLDSGRYSEGTEWTREEQDFMDNFDVIEE